MDYRVPGQSLCCKALPGMQPTGAWDQGTKCPSPQPPTHSCSFPSSWFQLSTVTPLPPPPPPATQVGTACFNMGPSCPISLKDLPSDEAYTCRARNSRPPAQVHLADTGHTICIKAPSYLSLLKPNLSSPKPNDREKMGVGVGRNKDRA